MMRLSMPTHRIDAVALKCIEGITGNNALRTSLTNATALLGQEEALYEQHAGAGTLHHIPTHGGTDNPVVLGALKKSELLTLYDYYLANKEKPARKVYEAILSAAADRCPFCGGIGTPRNLDHFLPKSVYPQFSVLPMNLVPSCRDCNMDGKRAEYALVEGDQVLHPYCDKADFFLEPWISCQYDAVDLDDVGEFTYRCAIPAAWGPVDAQRATRHFDKFGLAHRYSVKAAESLRPMLTLAKRMLSAGDRETVAAYFRESADDALFANHWQAGMHRALGDWLSR